MQKTDWEDLRSLAAVMTTGRIAAAARVLGVDPTTVSRRIARLEAGLGETLLRRRADGSVELTPAGLKLADLADGFGRALEDILGPQPRAGGNGISGTVRLTAVPFIANRIIAPAAGALLERHEGLRLDIVAEARDLDLARREADMALRMARPDAGGHRLKTRRIATLAHGVYGSRSPEKPESAAWVGYDDVMAHLPHARWIRARAREEGGAPVRLQVRDMETALECVAVGGGRSVFPVIVAARDPRLVEMECPTPVPSRDVWLIVHADLAGLSRIAGVADWLETLFDPRRL